MDSFLSQNDSALHHQLAILHSEFAYWSFEDSVYYFNQDIIRRSLDSPQSFHAYYEAHSDDTLKLKIAEIESLPSQIHSISINGKENYPVSNQVILPAKSSTAYLQFQEYTLVVPGLKSDQKIKELEEQLIESQRSDEEIIGLIEFTNEGNNQ